MTNGEKQKVREAAFEAAVYGIFTILLFFGMFVFMIGTNATFKVYLAGGIFATISGFVFAAGVVWNKLSY